MNLPLFPPTDDPGPSFSSLLHRLRGGPHQFPVDDPASITHGTTIVAIRYAEGVVMAGDRRATAGSTIAHRNMDKVYPADRQLQLEHYEKVEGAALSLEGKANQLAGMIRANMPMAFQGLIVVPIFAGYDLRRRRGRIFTYDVTGGRYEEADYHADGSGGRDARTTIKLGWKEDLDLDATVELAIQSLYEAAEEDSATGGPDPVRGIYPVIATIAQDGFTKVAESEVAARFGALIERRTNRGMHP